MLAALFEDKRMVCLCMCAWLGAVVAAYSQSGTHDSVFLRVGPSPHTTVMGITIDTWHKWAAVMLFAFCNTCANEFIGNSLSPWIINTLQDPKATTIPYPKPICVGIALAYTVYCHAMSLVGIALLLSQIDFFFVRVLADLAVSAFAMEQFLRGKTVAQPGYASVGDPASSSSAS